MAAGKDRCFFEELFSCSEKPPLSHTSIERIIQASKLYEDGLHVKLEDQQLQELGSVPVHRKCVDKYCHKKAIQKVLRERAEGTQSSNEDLTSKPKRPVRSEQPTFFFDHDCLFCGH